MWLYVFIPFTTTPREATHRPQASSPWTNHTLHRGLCGGVYMTSCNTGSHGPMQGFFCGDRTIFGTHTLGTKNNRLGGQGNRWRRVSPFTFTGKHYWLSLLHLSTESFEPSHQICDNFSDSKSIFFVPKFHLQKVIYCQTPSHRARKPHTPSFWIPSRPSCHLKNGLRTKWIQN